MSMPLMIYWILIKITTVNSAPKIGDVFYDPLIFESSHGYLAKEMMVPNLRRDVSKELSSPKETYSEGYIFDQNKCQLINGRILCGYDKNKGTYINEETFVDLNNGCRARGDRIECGYDNKKNLRRPNKQKLHIKGNKNNYSNARLAPTRTTPFETTTSDTNIIDSKVFAPNKLVKSVLEAILEKPVIEKVPVMKSAELFDPALTASSSIIENMSLSIASETPTLSTTNNELIASLTINNESKSLAETTLSSTPATNVSTVTPRTTESSWTSTSITTESNMILSSEIDFLDNDSSTYENDERSKLKNEINIDPIEMPLMESKLLDKILATVSESTTNIQTNIRNEPPVVDNVPESTTTRNFLRFNTKPNENFTTACIENGDRLVCYEFQT